ncbi:tRNA (guanine-N(7)-)-methyltransferase [Fibrobacterales bacterium]|nr:tRNA (guanine-N(7)-)-methyltransferase [Fibrobacterales bacterium]
MIEFKRTFYADRELPFLWHYVPEIDSAIGKPIQISAPVIPEEALQLEWFASPQKSVLEIGSGKGSFLCDYAQKFPEIKILGGEWDAACANLIAKKIAKLKIQNAQIIRGDLYYFLRDLVPSNSIDEIHMYFPDPWEKRRQQKNRLILRDGFLEQIHRIFKPATPAAPRLFYWATDHAEYNEVALQAFRKFPKAKILTENTAAPTCSIETAFEKKYKKEGRPIYRSIIEFSKH